MVLDVIRWLALALLASCGSMPFELSEVSWWVSTSDGRLDSSVRPHDQDVDISTVGLMFTYAFRTPAASPSLYRRYAPSPQAQPREWPEAGGALDTLPDLEPEGRGASSSGIPSSLDPPGPPPSQEPPVAPPEEETVLDILTDPGTLIAVATGGGVGAVAVKLLPRLLPVLLASVGSLLSRKHRRKRRAREPRRRA